MKALFVLIALAIVGVDSALALEWQSMTIQEVNQGLYFPHGPMWKDLSHDPANGRVLLNPMTEKVAGELYENLNRNSIYVCDFKVAKYSAVSQVLTHLVYDIRDCKAIK